MPRLLFISSSVRPDASHSHALGQSFCDAVLQQNPKENIVLRNVGISPPPHPNHAYTIANYTPPDQRTDEMHQALAASDALIDEVLSCDRLVFSVPMYNFSVPSTFKAYIDNLVRIGRTFTVTQDGGFAGLLTDKKALFITTRGATYAAGSPMQAYDHQEPYLRTVFGFMGLTDVRFIHADGLDFADADYRDKSLSNAHQALNELAQAW